MKINWWISLFFCFFVSSFLAQPIESSGIFALDLNSKKKIQTFTDLSFKSFKEKQNINIGYNDNDAVWCIITCKNNTNKTQQRVLVFDNIFLDSISFWTQNSAGVMGDRTSQRDEYISGYSIPLEMASGEVQEIKLRIKKTISLLNFSYRIDSEEVISENSRKELSIVSLLLGFMMLLIFFYLIVIFKHRKKIYILFILYALVSCVYFVVTSGFARYILTPSLFYAGEFRVFSGSFWYVLLGYFFMEFLQMKTHHKPFHTIANILNINLTVIILLSILAVALKIHSPLIFLTYVGYLHYLLILIVPLVCAIRHLKIDFRIAIYSLVSFLPHFIWLSTGLLKIFKILPNDLNLDWFIFASVFQGLIFGYALAKDYVDSFYKRIVLENEVLAEKQRGIQLISKAQVSERRKVASILHDNFGVKMANILHLAELDKKSELVKRIHDLSSDIRTVSHSILPKSLDDGLLLTSIHNHLDILKAAKPNLSMELVSFDFPFKIDLEWRFDLYLISLEIIHNALKHGEATEIDLEFYAYEESYVFQFTDNGKGFDANLVSGFGLNSMKRRVEQYNGSFEINSTMSEGTVIQISLPLS